ncbi:MAG: energy transducer TonB, partial [Bacteroidetes bacterium]|nr:energy transducer TonB [Bacteroidota bacterium]
LVMIFSFTRETEPNNLTGNFTKKGLNNTQLIITQEQDSTIPEEVFFIVEEMPNFQGKGLDGFRDWVMKYLYYPEIAAEKGIEGIVYIQFVVGKKGNVVSAVILRSANPLLDAEALRVVKSSPQWIPGKQKGKEVNVAFTIPVKFSLQEPVKTEPEEKVIPVEKKKQDEPVAKEEIPEGEIFFIVEDMPKFSYDSIESFDAFRKYVMYNLIYPEEAAKKGTEGKVFVQFVVDKNGDVKNVEIVKGAGPLLDAEAIRVIKSSPRWIPGKQKGKEVNVAFTFPIMFVTQ